MVLQHGVVVLGDTEHLVFVESGEEEPIESPYDIDLLFADFSLDYPPKLHIFSLTF